MINYPGFPIRPEPLVPRSNVQITTPVLDPAQIIMQAAQLRQQKELTQQKMQQDSMNTLVSAIQTAQQLQEHKREAMMNDQRAQQTLDMAKNKNGPEIELMKAHANYFNNMATGGDGAVEGAIGMLKNGLASPKDIFAMTGRWSPQQKTKLVTSMAQQGIDIKGLGLDRLTQEKQIATQEGAGFQQRIRGGESILPNFQDVIDQAKKLNLSSFAPANKIKLAALRQINNPDVAKYDTIRSAVAEEMGRYFGGGVSSDMKIKLGQAILGNDGANHEAIKAALMGAGGAYDVIQNQVKAYKGTLKTEPRPAKLTPEVRYSQLENKGMPEDLIHAQMVQEGY